jgi:hypothetical protein
MTSSNPAAPQGERFFFFYALALFAIVVIGFPVHALLDPEDLPPIRPLLHVHAVALGLWYALLVLQTFLIGARRVAIHKALGAASLLLVPVMIATGLTVSYQNMVRTEDATILIANTGNCTMFLLFYGSALALRGRAKAHKRFMLFAAVALMLPAFARIGYVLDLPELAVLPMWLAFLIAIPVYDLVRWRKVEWPSLIGIGLNLVYIASLIAITAPTSGN